MEVVISYEHFRRESDGVDLPAKFIMPRAKMASNFTITMAAEGKNRLPHYIVIYK